MNTPSGVKPAPSSLGFAMPAEWHSHAATWLSWPKNDETWPGKQLARVRESYLQMLEALLPHEKVRLLVADEKTGRDVKRQLEKMQIRTSNLEPAVRAYADSWIRDYGPTFVRTAAGK